MLQVDPFTSFLDLPAPGRRQSAYIGYWLLRRPVFLINSRQPHFCVTSSGFELNLHPTLASLVPKVREQFVEFLGGTSLERLSIFSLPTCVGL